MAECAEHPPYQGRLARPQVTHEVNHRAGTQQGGKAAGQVLRGLFVGKLENGVKIGTMRHGKDSTLDYGLIAREIKDLGAGLGFSGIGIARAELGAAADRLRDWLAAGRHGEMDYMARHADLRADPPALVAGTLTVISARLDYLPAAADSAATLADGERAYISRYALGRDYHKVVRGRLQKLAQALGERIGPFGYRVFSDSAPVMEVEFASRTGIGWRGKHTLLLSRQGSWHFLGEIYTDLPLPPDAPSPAHCGQCTACLAACPTGAIVAPYEVDARLCISYLTIELAGAIPESLRPLVGNRIYGCDDCQLCCPWNRFARMGDREFAVRHGLDAAPLTELFAWGPGDFEERLAGSPIRRIGHERWLRNIAVALGNGPATPAAVAALSSRSGHHSALVRDHVAWALARLGAV